MFFFLDPGDHQGYFWSTRCYFEVDSQWKNMFYHKKTSCLNSKLFKILAEGAERWGSLVLYVVIFDIWIQFEFTLNTYV